MFRPPNARPWVRFLTGGLFELDLKRPSGSGKSGLVLAKAGAGTRFNMDSMTVRPYSATLEGIMSKRKDSSSRSAARWRGAK